MITIETITAFTVLTREGIEALLLLMLFNRTAVTSQQRIYFYLGSLLGIVIPLVLAIAVSEWADQNEKYINIAANFITSILLLYVFIWSQKIMQHVKEHVSYIVSLGSFAVVIGSMAIVARESTEVMLMLVGSMIRNWASTVDGLTLAVLLLTLVGIVFHKITAKVNIARFFKVSSWVLLAIGIYYFYEGATSVIDLFGQMSYYQ